MAPLPPDASPASLLRTFVQFHKSGISVQLLFAIAGIGQERLGWVWRHDPDSYPTRPVTKIANSTPAPPSSPAAVSRIFPSARCQAVYACASVAPRFASSSLGPPAQALREPVNLGFPRLSEREAELRMGASLRGARTLRREPIRKRDVSLARSLAAGALSGGSWRRNRAALWRVQTAAPVELGGDLLGVPLSWAFSSGPDALQLGTPPAAARRPEERWVTAPTAAGRGGNHLPPGAPPWIAADCGPPGLPRPERIRASEDRRRTSCLGSFRTLFTVIELFSSERRPKLGRSVASRAPGCLRQYRALTRECTLVRVGGGRRFGTSDVPAVSAEP